MLEILNSTHQKRVQNQFPPSQQVSMQATTPKTTKKIPQTQLSNHTLYQFRPLGFYFTFFFFVQKRLAQPVDRCNSLLAVQLPFYFVLLAWNSIFKAFLSSPLQPSVQFRVELSTRRQAGTPPENGFRLIRLLAI